MVACLLTLLLQFGVVLYAYATDPEEDERFRGDKLLYRS
jgi:hypothetical protein